MVTHEFSEFDLSLELLHFDQHSCVHSFHSNLISDLISQAGRRIAAQMTEVSNNTQSAAVNGAPTEKKALPPNWNLSGTWQVIKERSDDLDAFFKVMGLNFMTRKLLCSLNRMPTRALVVCADFALFCSDIHDRAHARHVFSDRQKQPVHTYNACDAGLAAVREQEP